MKFLIKLAIFGIGALALYLGVGLTRIAAIIICLLILFQKELNSKDKYEP